MTDGSSSTNLAGSATQPGYQEGRADSARFYWISGFAQLNSTAVVLVDFSNHYIRLLDRQSLQTSTFVGECEKAGFRDGVDALFNEPHSIVKDAYFSYTLFLTDWGNDALRLISNSTRNTETLIQPSKGLKIPIGVSIDFLRQNLLIMNHHFMSIYNFTSQELHVIAGNINSGDSDGSLEEARFNRPRELISLTPVVTLVADQHNHLLKLVNTANNSVTSICTGNWNTIDGSVADCELLHPYSLLARDGLIYIGQKGAIRTLSCKAELIKY